MKAFRLKYLAARQIIKASGLMVATSLLTLAANSAQAHNNQVTIKDQGNKRCILSNGLPDHSTGSFPNRGNPHTISAQSIRLCVNKNPKKRSRATPIRGSIGVALNGVQIRPGTADYYDPSGRRGFSRNRSSGWNLEGMGARTQLGMDRNNAHVDQRGLYHYHGPSRALSKSGKGTLIGYAADGFEIHYVGKRKTSSYKLKGGKRSSGPGGRHDGTYVQDWQYVAGSGNLDQCNGGTLNGKFVYFATDTYPFFPRCLWGSASSDFKVGRGRGNQRGQRPQFGQGGQRPNNGFLGRSNQANNQSFGGQRPQGRGMGQGRFGPPQEALQACTSKNTGQRCGFNAPGGRQISGTCGVTPDRQLACMPRGGRRP
ncbi:YHYH protein [Cohaesibacter gelatinilyticus]|uniref:YHYH protein n=1 Tax=Cohaesibacter gelatinilyticus TaxID=372072 RepID=A0A285ND30_9HYPH|nr:YHYH protein [Cohaesibacter gelatinilyticus]SNZ06857.1 YHYH protein [Cohaesibacter gelatinilyticus]